MVGRRTVAAEHDVLHRSQTRKGLDVGIMRLKGHGVGKEEEVVDGAVNDTRAHLLVAAERTAAEEGKVPLHVGMFLLQGFLDECTGGAGAVKTVTDEALGIVEYPLNHDFFHGVVGHQTNVADKFLFHSVGIYSVFSISKKRGHLRGHTRCHGIRNKASGLSERSDALT